MKATSPTWEEVLTEYCSESWEDGGHGDVVLVVNIRQALREIRRLRAEVANIRQALREIRRLGAEVAFRRRPPASPPDDDSPCA